MKNIIKKLFTENLHIVLIILITTIIKFPSIIEPQWHIDESVYIATAQEMYKGERLYVDVWDNKPIPFYAIWYVSYYFFQDSMVGLRAFGAVLGILDSILILLIFRRLFHGMYDGRKKLQRYLIEGIVTIASIILLHGPFLEGNTINGETFFIPLVLGGIYFALKKKGKYRLYISGFLFGYAMMMKANPALDFFAVSLLIAAVDFKRQRYLLPNFLKLAVAALIPFIITIVAAAILGNAKDYIETIFFLNSNDYLGRVDTYAIPILKETIKYRALLAFVIAATSGYLYLKKKLSRNLFFLIVWFTFSWFAALISGRSYSHFFQQIVVPTIFLSVYLILLYIKNFRIQILLIIFITFVSLILPFLAYRDKYNYFSRYYYTSYKYIFGLLPYEYYVRLFDVHYDSKMQLYNFIKANTNSEQTLFYWSSETSENSSWAYAITHRTATTPYISDFHITQFVKDGKNLNAEYLNENSPDIIVKRIDSEEYPQLDKLIHEKYYLRWQIDKYNIYMKI